MRHSVTSWAACLMVPLALSSRTSPLPEKCTDLAFPGFDGFKTLQTHGTPIVNCTFSADATPISFCNFSVAINHPGEGDFVNIEVWLPLDTWNGRFLATGGGGYVAGHQLNLIEPILKGYATAFTDAGLAMQGQIDPSSGQWALLKTGEINWPLVTNFAHRSIHDMTVIAKAAIRKFYGTKPVYSYYSGCSTGGRMGYFSAEYYPEDFDGILANAPALHSANLSVGMEWPTAVMHGGVAVPQCVFEAYQKAYIAACDALDGATDGLISDPRDCNLDTEKLIGKIVDCSDGRFTITAAHADAVSKITNGAQSADGQISWLGIATGAPFSGLAVTNTTGNTTTVIPAPLGASWVKYFVAKDPDYSLEDLTVAEFERIYLKSTAEFTAILASEHPDLTAFSHAGHKLLSWHGLADEAINYQGTTWYREALKAEMGLEDQEVDGFYRLFLAPGVGHCQGGYGPVPVEPLKALVQWVEEGVAPDTLFARLNDGGNGTMTRNLCRYPEQLVYIGRNVKSADSFTCE